MTAESIVSELIDNGAITGEEALTLAKAVTRETVNCPYYMYYPRFVSTSSDLVPEPLFQTTCDDSTDHSNE